jgi:hypothetical protein
MLFFKVTLTRWALSILFLSFIQVHPLYLCLRVPAMCLTCVLDPTIPADLLKASHLMVLFSSLFLCSDINRVIASSSSRIWQRLVSLDGCKDHQPHSDGVVVATSRLMGPWVKVGHVVCLGYSGF